MNNKYKNRVKFKQKNINNKEIKKKKEDNILNEIIINKNDKESIKNIFETSPNKNTETKNPWKIVSVILTVLVIFCTYTLFNKKNDVKAKEQNIELKNDISEPKEKKHQQYLFLGDSIFEQYNVTEFFKGYDVINSGVGGARTDQVLENLDTRVFKYNPTTIFLLIGTNDLTVRTPKEEVVDNIKKIVEAIEEKIPDIKIYILSVFPINNTDNEKIINKYFETKSNNDIIETNILIKEYCEKNNIEYIDMTKILVDDEENLRLSYTTEGLHITDLGYHFITNELLKYMTND